MNRERLNARQRWLVIALVVVSCIPMTVILLLESAGVLNFSQRQLVVISVVNLIVTVPAAIFAANKWIAKAKS